MRMRWLVIPTALATATATALVTAPAASGDPAPAFPPGTHLAAGFPYGLVQGEPSLRVTPAGDIFVMAPASTPIGCELWRVAPDGRSATFLGAPDNGVGGGDCDLAVTPPQPGATAATLSYSSLTLANLTVGRSTDNGQTWTLANPAGSQIPLTDRQWMTAGVDGTIYMSYHIVETNNIAVAASTDGGMTYLDRGLAIDANHIAQALYNNMLGPIVQDRTSTLPVKPLYTIFTAPRNATENLNSVAGTLATNNFGVYLATSLDDGYTWTDTPIYEGDGSESYDHIFPSLDIDAEGGLWAAWSSGTHVYTAYRAPGSLTWTTPVQVDATGATSNLYAWVAGGEGGRADVVWYGGTAATYDDPGNVWNVYMAQVQFKPFGPATRTQTVVGDHPIHYGAICTTGVTCTGNTRDLLDFFQVALTPDGRAAIAWADDSPQSGGASAGATQVYASVQCAGLSATTGQNLPDTC